MLKLQYFCFLKAGEPCGVPCIVLDCNYGSELGLLMNSKELITSFRRGIPSCPRLNLVNAMSLEP